MSKKIIIFLFGLILFFTPLVVSAQKPEDFDPPEKNGVYDVPGRKNFKVRVFVHEPRNKSTTPVSTCSDNDSSAVVHPAGWKLPQGDWKYSLNLASAPSSVGSGNLSTITSQAFSQWQSAVNNKVNFVPGTNTATDRKALDGTNLIAWGRTSGTALAVTYTWYYTSSGQAVETDTIFNKKFPWGWSATTCNANYYDAQNILTHELGHWVGLNDEYDTSYVDNTMYGYGSKGEIKKDTLTTGDKTGATNLYP
jgi:hypothetical protein